MGVRHYDLELRRLDRQDPDHHAGLCRGRRLLPSDGEGGHEAEAGLIPLMLPDIPGMHMTETQKALRLRPGRLFFLKTAAAGYIPTILMCYFVRFIVIIYEDFYFF